MTKTEFLFGHTKEHYGPELEVLAHQRIRDGRKLATELYQQLSYDPAKQNEEQYQLHYRLRKVTDAIETWKKILEIEDE